MGVLLGWSWVPSFPQVLRCLHGGAARAGDVTSEAAKMRPHRGLLDMRPCNWMIMKHFSVSLQKTMITRVTCFLQCSEKILSVSQFSIDTIVHIKSVLTFTNPQKILSTMFSMYNSQVKTVFSRRVSLSTTIPWREAAFGDPSTAVPFSVRVGTDTSNLDIWLVVWNMNFIFPCIGNNHPNWLIFFRGVETTNQLLIVLHLHMIKSYQIPLWLLEYHFMPDSLFQPQFLPMGQD